MKRRLLHCAVWGAILLFAAVFGLRIRAARRTRALAEAPLHLGAAAVAVTPVVRRDLTERVTVTGVVRPRNEVDVFSKVPGRLEQVLVKVGDRVRAGQLLAVVEHREIEWQAKQAAAQAQAAAAGLAQAHTNRDAANTQLERYRQLRTDNAVPQAELERIETAFLAAQTGVTVAKAQVSVTEAAAGLAGEALRNAQIVAPISGTVTKRLVNAGTQVSPAQALFQLQDVAALKLEGTVDAVEFGRLRVGEVAHVRAEDLPGVVFGGSIATLSPTLDPQTRRAAVEVAIQNPEGKLLTNMFGRVEIEVAKRPGVLVVPASAVVAKGERRLVYVVKNGRAAAVPVLVGAGDGDDVAVESGLALGDEVVVGGQAGLSDGASVVVKDAARAAQP